MKTQMQTGLKMESGEDSFKKNTPMAKIQQPLVSENMDSSIILRIASKEVVTRKCSIMDASSQLNR